MNKKLNKLASLIAKHEGKKSQVNIRNIREVLAILSDLIFDDIHYKDSHKDKYYLLLMENGKRRFQERRKK